MITYTSKIHVTRIVDGNTVIANIDLGFGTMLMERKIDLYGVRSPKLSLYQHSAGLLAKQFLDNLISLSNNTLWFVSMLPPDNFGRLCGVMYYETDYTTSINQKLLLSGYAKPYKDNDPFTEDEIDKIMEVK